MGKVADWFTDAIESATGVKSSRIQAEATSSAAELQYEAALKQIEAQREANAKQQQFNKDEAELAFQRNSSKGQLQQLLDAGLSEMQARQIIAGGSAGSYTAAPSVNQNQGVDYTAPAAAQSAKVQADALVPQAYAGLQQEMYNGTITAQVVNAFRSGKLLDTGLNIGANLLGSSLSASDGGIIGAMSTAPLQGTILRNINGIPDYARGSYGAFCAFAASAAAPGWMKTADFQNQLQMANSSPMAMKSLQNFFKTDNQLLTGETYFKNLQSESEMKSAAARIASFKVDEESMTRDLMDIEQDYKIAILPDRYAAQLTNYQRDCAQMATERDLWSNDEYKRLYIMSQLKNTESAAIMAKIMTLKHQGAFDHLNEHPELAQMFGIYQMWSDVGMTDDLFGEIVASIDAVGSSTLGFGVADILQSVKEWIDTKKNKKGLL